MTELTVQRECSRDGFTPGELLWNGEHQCWTCEDVIREIPGAPVSSWKVQNQTAIPSGRYEVTIDYSPHFQKNMPHVMNVPGFDGVRIHIGNTAKDTEGCLLVGDAKATSGVAQSTACFNTLFQKIEDALKQGQVFITYVNPPGVTT